MRYVRIENGQVAAYPYTYSQLRADNPNTSFPRTPGPWLEEYGVYAVADTARPAPSSISVNVVEGAPTLANGQWVQSWVEVPASAEEIAEREEAAAQEGELTEAKLDAWIVAFLAMTPAEAQAYINANGATVAALRTNVARLAYAVRVLVRREFGR